MAPPRKTKGNRKNTVAAPAEVGKEAIPTEDVAVETKQNETKEVAPKGKRGFQPKRAKAEVDDEITAAAPVANSPTKAANAKPAAKEDSPKAAKKSPKVKKGSMKAKKRASPKKAAVRGAAANKKANKSAK